MGELRLLGNEPGKTADLNLGLTPVVGAVSFGLSSSLT